ncbi:ABC transporter permease [Streptomyces paludis]|uniref:ABC transporter permease n=1 Tax=Streptomyces paludis TaxID=2282738 RepID=A0A345I1B1_9ACTN|nr:ABC transporter permease [Streptomyces paludis]
MTPTTGTPPTNPSSPASPSSPTAGVLTLARTEARRLLLHPALLASLVLCVGLWVYDTVFGPAAYPVLHDEARFLQVQLLLPAAGTFLAVHLAVLRPARDGTDAWFEALVLEPWQRVAAHLLAVLPVAGAVAVLAGARITWLALLPGAVSAPAAAELATGPAAVLLAGVLAVLVATLIRSVAAGPITLGILGIATVVGALFPFSGRRWWGLIAIEDEMRDLLPSGLAHRPAGLHVLYLVLLAVGLGAAALLRSGLRGRTVTAVVALALAGALTAGAAQSRPEPGAVTAAGERAVNSPSGEQRCVRRESVTYCAFPEYLDRHRQWSEVVDGILRWVPDEAKERRYTVRQHIVSLVKSGGLAQITIPVDNWAADDRRAGTEGAVVAGSAWGNDGDYANDATIGFAAAFAQHVTAAGRAPNTTGTSTRVCGGQSLVTLWLAAQATPETASALRSRMSRSFGGAVGFGTLTTVDAERGDAEAVLRLLERPTEETGARIKRSWNELTDPATTSQQAAQLLGISAPAPEQGAGEDALCAGN